MKLRFSSRMQIPAAMSSTEARDTPRHWLHRVASTAVVLVLVIVASSAYLRQASVRLNCSNWPACTQRVTGEDPARAQPAAVTAARLVHRLSASIAGALVLLIAYLSSVQLPRVRSDIALSAALVALTVFLAVLGRWSRTSQAPLVALGNLLGGMTLLALLQWMRLRTSRAQASADSPGPLAPVAGAALTLALASVALGALVSSSHVLSAVRAESGELLAYAHLASGLLVLLLAGTLVLHPAAPASGRSVALAAFVLAIAQAMTGWVSTGFGYPLAAALAHNLLAAVLLIALVTAAYRYAGSSRASLMHIKDAEAGG
jgi:cytochrome c oxidase assembly protein subunit 15